MPELIESLETRRLFASGGAAPEFIEEPDGTVVIIGSRRADQISSPSTSRVRGSTTCS